MKKNSPLFISISLVIAAITFVFTILITTDGLTRAGRGGSYRSSSSSSRSSSSSYRSSSSRSSSSSWGSSSSSRRSTPYIPYSSTGTGTGTGSGTSSSSSSSSDPYGWVYGLIFMIVILGIVIFVIVKIVKGVGGLFGMGKKKDFDDSAPTAYEFNEALIDDIKKDDPDFSPEKFMEKAKAIAERLQEAWSNGDMLPARNYVSQGVFNRFRLQLELMAEQEKVKNILESFKVMKVSVLQMSASKSYQTLHVRMFASARDVEVPLNAGADAVKKAVSRTPKEPFAEIYSYTRKLGVKTNTSRDWLKGECPNCGYVPDNFSENNKCRSCGSVYNSGEFDWVLSEITQEEEWSPASSADVAGLAELEGKNLSINREVIEDRASNLFWRWIYSRITGSSAPLGRDATPGFVKGFTPGKSNFTRTSVGAVDLVSVSQAEDMVTSMVKVLWSASFQKGAEPYHQENNFTLKMPLALKNPYGLADHSCDHCGAPLPETDALKCTYCGGELQPNVSDWLLAQVEKIKWEEKQG